MGCTESKYSAEDFDSSVDMNLPKLYDIPLEKTQILVRQRLFSLSSDTFTDTDTEGAPYPSGQPIAVCLRQFSLLKHRFKIYTTSSLFESLDKSEHDLDGMPLYKFAQVEREHFGYSYKVTFPGEDDPVITIQTQSVFPRERVVYYRDQLAALIQGGTLSTGSNLYRITISPGMDSCLIICLWNKN